MTATLFAKVAFAVFAKDGNCSPPQVGASWKLSDWELLLPLLEKKQCLNARKAADSRALEHRLWHFTRTLPNDSLDRLFNSLKI